MIRLFPKIHDKFQVELKLEYLPESRDAQFHVRSWLFVPRQLGLSPRTYGREDWYRDLRSHLRYKTPTAGLPELAAWSAPVCRQLSACVENALAGGTLEASSALRREVRLFACVVKAALRDRVFAWRSGRRPKEALTILQDGARLLHRFRAVTRPLGAPKIPAEANEACRIIDTFLSGLLEQHALELLEDAEETVGGKKRKSPKGKKNRERVRRLARFVLDLSATETLRRQKKDPLRRRADGWDPGRLERRSTLKKFAESVLYLPVRLRVDGALKEQLSFAVAAGIAMTFATLAAFWAQFNPGQLTLPALFLVVLSYMFKDRIKDWLKGYFATRMRRSGFDYVREAWQGKAAVARIHDRAWWMDGVGEAPEAVRQARGQDPDAHLEGSGLEERVLGFVRRVEVHPEAFERARAEAPAGAGGNASPLYQGITEILRLNIRAFTRCIDDPSKRLWVLEEDGKPRQRKFSRLYWLHWVLELEGGGQRTLHAFRLGFNRKGLRSALRLPDNEKLEGA